MCPLNAPLGETSADAMCEVSGLATGIAIRRHAIRRRLRVLEVRKEARCGGQRSLVKSLTETVKRPSGERIREE